MLVERGRKIYGEDGGVAVGREAEGILHFSADIVVGRLETNGIGNDRYVLNLEVGGGDSCSYIDCFVGTKTGLG